MAQLYEFNLRDYWAIFLRRKWEVLIAFFVVFISISIYTSFQVPIYRASVLIKVEPMLDHPSDILFPGSRMYWGRQFELSDYSKQIVASPILELALKELGWIKDDTDSRERDRLVSEVSGRTSAVEIEKSNMIRLSTEFEDPEKAANIANRIAEVFKRLNAEQKNEQTRNVRIFIEQTLNEVSNKLEEQEERLRLLTTQGVVGSGVAILQRISESEKKLTELSTKFTESHPNIIGLKEEIDGLKVELRNLPKEEFEYGILKRDITLNENLYTSLKQQLQTAQIKEAEKIDNIILVNPAVIPKHPFYPNKTKNHIIGIMLGLILGVTIALITEHLDTSIGRVDDVESFIKVGVIGLIPYCSEQHREEEKKEKKGQRVFFKKAIKEEALRPTHILELKKTESTSLFLEAFRLLGVNLQVLFGKNGRIKNKIIMITSCKPEEGKTVVVSVLGLVMAQMGYRVLIIDADVRRAHIHRSFGLKEKENGLTDILTGKISADSAVKTITDMMLGTASIDSIIERTWLNNLNVVTAGSTFPNTITLFNSDKLNETLNYFKNRYEIILMDTSPILAVSEPSILVPKTDGILLVYRAGFTSRLALRRAKSQIESLKGKGSLSGVILNNITPEIGMDTYYYYSKRYYDREKSRR